jgi:hypothetical protein
MILRINAHPFIRISSLIDPAPMLSADPASR